MAGQEAAKGGGGMSEYIWLDKQGWPLELFKRRPITNFIRILLHARGRERKSDYIARTGIPVA
jgi:hypothetical protein